MSTSAKQIIGVAGTLSSGKDTFAEYLEKEKGYMHVSTSDMLRAEKKKRYGNSSEALLKRGDPFANNLRKEKGPGILVELAYNEFVETGMDRVVISGIRSIGEVEILHKLGGKLIFVDADPEVRFTRATGRGRDEQDEQTIEEFLAQEAVETEGLDPNDKTIQNLPAMKKMADQVVTNDSDLKSFIEKINAIVG